MKLKLEIFVEKDQEINVLGEPLQSCSEKPLTGFYRDGMCNTCDEDVGSHTVCIQASKEFLEYSRFKGNDLSTPMPEYGFAGLREGDYWCLCAPRWLEAYKEGWAPKVRLESTHEETLVIIPIEILEEYSVNLKN